MYVKKLKATEAIDAQTQAELDAELKNLVFQVANLAEEKKAIDTDVLDLTKIDGISEYMIICAGNSPAQLKAIARHIEESLSKIGIEPSHAEGKYGDKWFLLDYLDFIVHIIDEDARNFYNLEELWSGAIFIPANEWNESL